MTITVTESVALMAKQGQSCSTVCIVRAALWLLNILPADITLVVAAVRVQCTNPIVYNDCGSLLGGYLVRPFTAIGWHAGGMVLSEADAIWMIRRVSRNESIATLTVGSQIPLHFDWLLKAIIGGFGMSTAISRQICFRPVWQWLGAYHMYKNMLSIQIIFRMHIASLDVWSYRPSYSWLTRASLDSRNLWDGAIYT